MKISLRTELADLIRENIQSGAYASIDEFVEQAVFMLPEQEVCLAANRSEIQHQIEEGYEAARPGKLLHPGEKCAPRSLK